MRVHIYTLRFNPVSGGGSHHQLEIYIEALKSSGHTPLLTTLFSRDNNFGKAPCEMREENFRGGFLALQHYVANLMRTDPEANVRIAFGPTLMWGAGMYAKNSSTPVVACLNNYTLGMGHHGTPSHAGGFFARIADHIRRSIHRTKWYAWEHVVGIRHARAIHRAFFDSPIVLQEYEKFGYRFRDTLVLPGAVESATNEKFPSPFQDDDSLFRVLFVGRLIKEKGADLLVKAAAQLPSQIHIHLIGSGPEDHALRQLIEEYKLGARVFLHGWTSREKLPAFYQNVDLFAHPCRWPEPFGLVIAQALGYGLPVIATESTGSAWAAGDAGITFKKNSVAELQKKILFFYNDAQVRSVYKAKALVRAREFDPKVIGRTFVSNLEALV